MSGSGWRASGWLLNHPSRASWVLLELMRPLRWRFRLSNAWYQLWHYGDADRWTNLWRTWNRSRP